MLISFRLHTAASNLITRFLFSGGGRERGWVGGGGKRREETIGKRLDSQTNNILFFFNWRPKEALRLARKTRITLVTNRDWPAFTLVFPRCLYVMWILIGSLDRLESLWLLDGNRYNTLLTCDMRFVSAALDVLIAINNDVELDETRTVHFAWLFNNRFERINRVDRVYSYCQFFFVWLWRWGHL